MAAARLRRLHRAASLRPRAHGLQPAFIQRLGNQQDFILCDGQFQVADWNRTILRQWRHQILLLGLQQRISRKPAHKHRFHPRAQQPRGNASCRRFILSVAFLQGIPHHADRRRRQLLSNPQQQHQVATEHPADSRQRLHVPRNGPSVQTHSGGLLQESRESDSLRTRQPETRIYRRECFERIHHGNRLQTLRTVCSRHRLMDKLFADEDPGDAQRRESAAPYGPAL